VFSVFPLEYKLPGDNPSSLLYLNRVYKEIIYGPEPEKMLVPLHPPGCEPSFHQHSFTLEAPIPLSCCPLVRCCAFPKVWLSSLFFFFFRVFHEFYETPSRTHPWTLQSYRIGNSLFLACTINAPPLQLASIPWCPMISAQLVVEILLSFFFFADPLFSEISHSFSYGFE